MVLPTLTAVFLFQTAAPVPSPLPSELVQAIARADAAFRERRFAQAREDYDRALALRPRSRTLREQIARCHAGAGEHEQELAAVEALAREEPDDRGLRVWRAEAALRAGHLDRARTALASVDLAGIVEADVAFNLAALLINRGAIQDALPYLDRAIVLDPAHLDAHFRRGLAYVHLGRRIEARRDLARVVELAPHSPEATTAREGLQTLK